MDKFFNSTFDALTNVVPGSMIIASLILFDSSLLTIDDIIEKLNKIELGSAALLIFISYVLGFAITPIGKFLYQKIGFRIWKLNPIPCQNDLSVSDKFILVRQFSSDNFKYIESWNMFCNLAHNLAFSSLILFLGAMFRIIVVDGASLTFIVIAVLAILLFLLFLNRAVLFRIWAINDLNAAVDTLDLISETKSGPKRFDIKLTRE